MSFLIFKDYKQTSCNILPNKHDPVQSNIFLLLLLYRIIQQLWSVNTFKENLKGVLYFIPNVEKKSSESKQHSNLFQQKMEEAWAQLFFIFRECELNNVNYRPHKCLRKKTCGLLREASWYRSILKIKGIMSPHTLSHEEKREPLETTLPGEEVLQWSGLILFLTDNTVSLLLLHLSNAGGKGVDVVKHSLHGNGNLIRLLTKEQINYILNLSEWC